MSRHLGSNDRDPKIVPFETASPPAPEDDPANWIYPHETKEDADLRILVEEISQLDDTLSGLLANMAAGDVSTGELVGQLDQWQKSMGGGKTLAPTQPPSPRPWLV